MMTCPIYGSNKLAPLYTIPLQYDDFRFVTTAAAAPYEEDLKTLYGAGYFQGEEYADWLGNKKSSSETCVLATHYSKART